MKFSIKDFLSKYDYGLIYWRMVLFTEEILNGKLNFFAVFDAC